MKYIVVIGGSLSNIGKGLVSSSTGVLLKSKEYDVSFIKIDPYINIDAGRLSPSDHGEVYVLEDGSEVDMDFGNYERFLNIGLSNLNSITTGKIYDEVIKRVKSGFYMAKTVQITPHVTDYIEERIQKVSRLEVKEEDGSYIPDICIIELGGTPSDIESIIFVEALRRLKNKVGPSNFMIISVEFLPKMQNGDQKTKIAQSSVKKAASLGIKPDVIITRCENSMSQSTKQKISDFCEISINDVYDLPITVDAYDVPNVLNIQNYFDSFVKHLNLENKNSSSLLYFPNLNRINEKSLDIAIVGKYTSNSDCYLSVVNALRISCAKYNHHVNIVWIESTDLEEIADCNSLFNNIDAMLIPGGFGTRGIEGKITAAKYARENNIPFLGICLGFQVAVIEFCRNVLKISDANSEEFDALGKNKVIIRMRNKINQNIEITDSNKENQISTFQTDNKFKVQKNNVGLSYSKNTDLNQEKICLGKTLDLKTTDSYILTDEVIEEISGMKIRSGTHDINLKKESKAFEIYFSSVISERHRHRYEVNSAYASKLQKAGLLFVGHSVRDNRIEMLELSDHPFFIGVQYHPEFNARPEKSHPLFNAFIEEAIKRKYNDQFF
ncbi:CTP synthase [Hamiltosporidium tvaerminnensis]|uniref:CTP synthase n=1 Tax=Hamiltosporidium tvaerminnensis TaxID=1176355 RepID=A0A4Q9M2H8_9MICR|nr:CTP synthase [Hamiltosporidium tvaerminnensis]